jgi:hypothetical protein
MALRDIFDKAKAKAQEPEFQEKVKRMAKQQAERRRTNPGSMRSGRRAFGGGGPNHPDYPLSPGDPMYGSMLPAGFYQDGMWYEQDSDGDGIPDSQDPTPYGEDQQQDLGDTEGAFNDADTSGAYQDDQGMDDDGGSYGGDSGYDGGGGDSGGDSGGGGDF